MPNSIEESVTLMLATTALILLLAGFIINILYLYQKKQLSFQKNITEINLDHEKILLQRQVEIQEQTLLDVSRDIHDNISLGLTLSKLHLNTLNYMEPESFPEKIQLSIHFITEAIYNLKNIALSLNADIIVKLGFIKAVENEFNNFDNTGLFKIKYEINGDVITLEAKKELAIFRIIQESLNNILKHSEAKNIFVNIEYTDTMLCLFIHDDGIGFTVEEGAKKKDSGGSGLTNIKERIRMIDGNCEILSAAGKGTSISISVPISNSKNDTHG